jgi:uncharacterized paraquat-inducible protein A
MQTWKPYMETDAVNYRPVPTVGERSDLLDDSDFWITSLDIVTHLFLPTLADTKYVLYALYLMVALDMQTDYPRVLDLLAEYKPSGGLSPYLVVWYIAHPIVMLFATIGVEFLTALCAAVVVMCVLQIFRWQHSNVDRSKDVTHGQR